MRRLTISKWLFLAFGVFFAASAMAPGCSSEDSSAPIDTNEADLVCSIGAHSGCACPDGTSGLHVCNSKGSAFGKCDCVSGCEPDTYLQCECANGYSGSQRCYDDGAGYGNCYCGGGGCVPGLTQPCTCDGGAVGGQTCSADGANFGGCVCPTASCGDGIVDEVEVCDDGNGDDTDACTSHCLPPYCGDGFVQPNEECDDGNTDDSDLCSWDCQEAVGGCDSCGDVLLNYESDPLCTDDGSPSSADLFNAFLACRCNGTCSDECGGNVCSGSGPNSACVYCSEKHGPTGCGDQYDACAAKL